MKPYYTDGQYTIYNADCREILDDIPADCLLTDPPYNVKHGIGAHHKSYLTMPFPMAAKEYAQFC